MKISNVPSSRRRKGLLAATLALTAGLATAGPVETLQPGSWYEVPGSTLRSVEPRPTPPGTTGLSSLMKSWNGAAFDSQRDRLIVWGGGHTNYAGNELYTFDLNTLSWTRLTDPSYMNSGYNFSSQGWSDGDEAYPDGTPVARHTYSGLAYLPPPFDAFWSTGGSKWRNGNGTTAAWQFDLDPGVLSWRRLSKAPSSMLGAVAAYDPVDRKVWFQSKNHVLSYDPATDTWAKRTSFMGGQSCDGKLPAYMTGAIDPVKRLFVLVGGGCAFYYDISVSGNVTRRQVGGTGSSDIKSGKAPGFTFDSANGVFIGWNGGSAVYSLDMNVSPPVWVRHATTGADPGITALNGTYGRLQYSPNKNVIVLVNEVDKNVFIYRHGGAANAPPALPITPAKPGVQLAPVN